MNPTASPARSSFVTVMAWLTLAVAALGVAGNGLQALLVLAFPQSADLSTLLPPGTPQPAMLGWLARHMLALSLWSVAGSLLLGWVSWALLQRREWARLAFIALLVLAALANFACIPLAGSALSMVVPATGASSAEELARLQATVGPMLTVLRAMLWIASLAIAGLHGWIVWRLCRADIRAEFG